MPEAFRSNRKGEFLLRRLDEIAAALAQPFGKTAPFVLDDMLDGTCQLFTAEQARVLFEDYGYRCGFLSPRHEFFGFVRDKALVPVEEYESLPQAYALLRAGTPAIFRALHTRLVNARTACSELACAVRLPVHANGYWTMPGAICFPLHADSDTVLAIQLRGAKRWLLSPPREKTLDDPAVGTGWIELGEGSYPPAEQAAYDITLYPGQALLVPRGWGHYALAQGGESLHVSLGMLHPEMGDKVQQQHPVLPRL